MNLQEVSKKEEYTNFSQLLELYFEFLLTLEDVDKTNPALSDESLEVLKRLEQVAKVARQTTSLFHQYYENYDAGDLRKLFKDFYYAIPRQAFWIPRFVESALDFFKTYQQVNKNLAPRQNRIIEYINEKIPTITLGQNNYQQTKEGNQPMKLTINELKNMIQEVIKKETTPVVKEATKAISLDELRGMIRETIEELAGGGTNDPTLPKKEEPEKPEAEEEESKLTLEGIRKMVKETVLEEKKNWIKGAIKDKGSLRATAKKQGLVKGDEKLSKTDLEKLSHSSNKKTAKRANLAKTLKKMH